MPFFERDKVRMHYEVVDGIVERDTIAFHGNLASNTWWLPMRDVLSQTKDTSKKTGRLILAEWRGCGKSTGLSDENELSLSEIAADYNGLLQSLNISQACAIGHSTGCLIALYAMRKAPDLYSRALLLDPVGATGAQFGPEMYSAFTQMSQDRAFCAAVMAGTIHGAIAPDLMEKIVDDAFGVHPLVWHGVPRMLHNVDFRAELPAIKQAVLVLHGEHDVLLPMENSEGLAAGLPNAKFQALAGRGHSCNVEAPGLLVEKMNNFLYG